MRGTDHIAALRSAGPARTFRAPPSGRPAGSGERAGGGGAGRAWTGRRGGHARREPRRHRRGVPPSVTWVQRVTGRPAERARGRGRGRPESRAGAPRGAAVPRHAGAAPGRAGPRAYPAGPARDPLPLGAGRAGRGARRRSRGRGGGPLPFRGPHPTTERPPTLDSVSSKGSPHHSSACCGIKSGVSGADRPPHPCAPPCPSRSSPLPGGAWGASVGSPRPP